MHYLSFIGLVLRVGKGINTWMDHDGFGNSLTLISGVVKSLEQNNNAVTGFVKWLKP
jgi:hypothetical protein